MCPVAKIIEREIHACGKQAGHIAVKYDTRFVANAHPLECGLHGIDGGKLVREAIAGDGDVA